MDFRWPDEYLAFRDEVDAFIQQWRTPELAAEIQQREGAPGPLSRKYFAALQDRGWMRMCWPADMGGEASGEVSHGDHGGDEGGEGGAEG